MKTRIIILDRGVDKKDVVKAQCCTGAISRK